MIASPTSGVLMRFDATTGTRSARLTRPVAERNAARGTLVAMVGIRASCQPMPVLSSVMPACFERLRDCDRLVHRVAALDEVEQRQPEHDDERGPAGGAHRADDLDGEAHPAVDRAAPSVVAPIHPPRQELVDQVALAAHDLDAVVAGGLRELRGTREVADHRADASVVHAPSP